MVLTRIGALAGGAALLALAACIHGGAPVARAPTPTAVAVAYAFDHMFDRGESPPPGALAEELADVLQARNLPPREVPFDRSEPVFTLVRDTTHRFARLAELDPRSPILLLVELRAEFLTASEGLYSWRVYCKLTAGRRESKEPPITNEFSFPATLQFDHMKEPEAVAQLATTIGEKVGNLMDTLLQLPPLQGAAASAAPARPPPLALEPGADAIYFVLLDRFANGDRTNDGLVDPGDPAAFHGGDIKGVLQHLDALKDLGVRTVWLSPVFKTRGAKFFGHGAFHGYWVEDLTAIEPRFGTTEELRALSDALHARGMRLVLDMVLNHTAFDAPLTREHPDWFHHRGDIKDWNDPAQVLNGDVMGLPDLAQENPDVQRYLLDASYAWADVAAADGFRLDAVRHVPLSFWATYSARMHAHAGKQFFLLGELLDGSPSVLSRAEREGGFDALFDFPLHYAMVDVFCRDKAPARLAAVLSLDRLYLDPDALVTLLDNHDLPRIVTACHGDLNRVRRALTFQLTARGTPSITYGTEIALAGEKEPANRGDMRFGGEPPLRDTLKALLRLRRGHPSLREGATQVVALQDGLFGYARVAADEAALILTSTRSRPFSVGLPPELAHATVVDALSGQPISGPPVVPPNSVRVLLATTEKPGGFAAWAERARAQMQRGERRRPVELVARGAPAAEELYVVGSSPELGAWDPEHAVGPLSAHGTRVELPVDGVYEYKLVVKRKGRALEWEPGDNRTLWVKDGTGTLKAELVWGHAP